jgi:addiction module HigA family antidote
MANKDRLPPIHPGEILREEFLSPLGMSAHQLAMALRVPATRINDIVNEKRGITADTALRLSRYFGTTSRFWMNMQTSWELEVAEDQLGTAVRREVLAADGMKLKVPIGFGHTSSRRCLGNLAN